MVNLPHWGFLQWSGALIGLVIAVSITFVQKVLYSSPTHSQAGLVVTTLVLIFVIISEIGAPIEKEGMKMKEASQNSAVFKAVVGQINGSTEATSHYSHLIAAATAEKAQHEFELKRCERHQAKGEPRVQRCKDYENRQIAQAQAKIDSYRSSANTSTHNNESARLSLIQQAKALEYNTDHHSELVKLTASVLGTNFLASMMFLSLVLIVAFEAGFHFVGSRIGVLKATLSQLGNKEILRQQELTSLKKEKRFKDESAYINPKHKLQIKNSAPSKPSTSPTISESPNPSKPSTPPISSENAKPSTLSLPPIVRDKIPLKIIEKPAATPAQKKEISCVPTVTETVGTRTISNTKSQQSTPEKPPKAILNAINFDIVYEYVKQQLAEEKIRLSIRNMRKVTHQYMKQNPSLDKISLSITDCNYLVNQIRDKMLEVQFIIENPNYRKGKAKYLLAKPKCSEINDKPVNQRVSSEENTDVIKSTLRPVLA